MTDTIRIRPWPDPVIDTLGHDPRSHYVETFWLPTLGPTCILLLRHLAQRFEEDGQGEDGVVELPIAATAQALGLGPREGRNSPFFRSFSRLSQFDLAVAHGDGTVAVRRNLPPISRRHLHRLPDHLREAHDAWVRRSESPRKRAERRARRTALTLVELGADVDVVERTLERLGFPPVTARASATWADAAHRALEREGVAGAGEAA